MWKKKEREDVNVRIKGGDGMQIKSRGGEKSVEESLSAFKECVNRKGSSSVEHECGSRLKVRKYVERN